MGHQKKKRREPQSTSCAMRKPSTTKYFSGPTSKKNKRKEPQRTSCAMRKASSNKIYLWTYFTKKQKKITTENFTCYEEGHQQQNISLDLLRKKTKKKNHREPHVL